LITYFDTSAFVPLLIEEESSERFSEMWKSSERIASTRLLFVESAATLERARRGGRIGQASVDSATDLLHELWHDIETIELDGLLMQNASTVALRTGLRGYDAVHCAAALQMVDEEVVAVAGDRRLLQVWSELGLPTYGLGPNTA